MVDIDQEGGIIKSWRKYMNFGNQNIISGDIIIAIPYTCQAGRRKSYNVVKNWM